MILNKYDSYLSDVFGLIEEEIDNGNVNNVSEFCCMRYERRLRYISNSSAHCSTDIFYLRAEGSGGAAFGDSAHPQKKNRGKHIATGTSSTLFVASWCFKLLRLDL